MNAGKLISVLCAGMLLLCGCGKNTTGKVQTCTVSIECTRALENAEKDSRLWEILPEDGLILKESAVEFTEGESAADVLQRVCRENAIHLETSAAPGANAIYVEGIGNLYEFDLGSTSGWMYSVNGIFPNYGCSAYLLKDGDAVEWRYTCDLGKDVGGGQAD